jgi:hypothetical protein
MLARNVRLCLLHGSCAVQEQTTLIGLTSLAAFPREPLHRSVAPLAEPLCAFQPRLPEYRSHTDQNENPASIENDITKRPKATVPERKKQPTFVPKTSKE